MSEPTVVAGVVLAAGAGTRFGMPKVLAAEGDWLKTAVRALVEGGCAHVVVVLGAAVVDVPQPAEAVVACDWSDGLSASLRAGVGAAARTGADLVALQLVDTPDIGGDVIARVVAAAGETGLARATYDGRPGHPVVIARRHWPELLRVVHGDEGAKPFLRARTDVVAVECGDLATGADIDVSP